MRTMNTIEHMIKRLHHVHGEDLLQRCQQLLHGPLDVSLYTQDAIQAKSFDLQRLHADVSNALRQMHDIAEAHPVLALEARDGVAAYMTGNFTAQTAAFTLSNWVIPIVIELLTIVKMVSFATSRCGMEAPGSVMSNGITVYSEHSSNGGEVVHEVTRDQVAPHLPKGKRRGGCQYTAHPPSGIKNKSLKTSMEELCVSLCTLNVAGCLWTACTQCNP